ncbi:MAG: DsbA family protein [Acidisphaera sp.]|nr:DsbA family protein [Acidisphaera sp.]
MPIRRQFLLGVVGALAFPGLVRAQAATDSRLGERAFGHPDAKATVTEFFSLTCTHCAAFQREVMPKITAELIDTGRLRFLYRDFPLDQVALTAAMVARALPPERYEAFISALFASQDRWAFAPEGGNSTEALAKMAALAGMPRPVFDATIADDKLKQAILAGQQQAETQYHIDSTPSFLCNGKTRSGEMGYGEFVQFISGAAG